MALWLGAQLLSAPASDLQAAASKDFAALAVLLVALRLPALLPGPRGVGAVNILLGVALLGRAGQAVWRSGEDRLLMDYLRRKELDLQFQEVAAAIPDDVPRSGRRQGSNGTPAQSVRRSSAGGSPA